MRFLDRFSPQWAEALVRWLSFISFTLLSPMRWLAQVSLSPYLRLNGPADWGTLPEQFRELAPDVIQFKLIPIALVCLATNIAYILLCRKLSKQLSQFLRQRFETPSA